MRGGLLETRDGPPGSSCINCILSESGNSPRVHSRVAPGWPVSTRFACYDPGFDKLAFTLHRRSAVSSVMTDLHDSLPHLLAGRPKSPLPRIRVKNEHNCRYRPGGFIAYVYAKR